MSRWGARTRSRADMDFLVELMEITREHGGDRFRFCDTLGILDPFTMYDKVRYAPAGVPELDIEVHTHNDLGMATANAIAGMQGRGALCQHHRQRPGGAGRQRRAGRGGHGAEACLRHRPRESTPTASRRCRALSPRHPIGRFPPGSRWWGSGSSPTNRGSMPTGSSRIRSITKGSDPADVGLKRHIVLGKHSGTSGVVERYRNMGISVSRKEAVLLLEQVRAIAQRVKRPLNEKELRMLHRNWGRKAA